jgi:hypothetical protein
MLLALCTQTIVIPRESRERRERLLLRLFLPRRREKKVKVLTHRPRYIETAKVSKLAEEPSSVVEPEYPALAEAKEESTEVPKLMVITEQEKTEMVEVPKRPTETKEKIVKKAEPRRLAKQPKILSPSQETELLNMSKNPAVTPKRRMTSVLDAIMESTKILTHASAEVPNIGEKNAKETVESSMTQVGTEVGPLVPAEIGHVKVVEENIEAKLSDATKTSKESEFPAAEASTEGLEFIVRHAAERKLSEEHIAEATHYAKDLKYPPGSLVFNGTDEDDFLYCLLDNKEIYVYREMAKKYRIPEVRGWPVYTAEG